MALATSVKKCEEGEGGTEEEDEFHTEVIAESKGII